MSRKPAPLHGRVFPGRKRRPPKRHLALGVKREPKRICSATTSAGKPCKAAAVTADGLCAAHGGLVDMKTIGRQGGLRRGKTAELELTDREQAMAALRRALDGGNKAAMVAAAKALIEHDLSPQPSRCRLRMRAPS